ncbi:exopolysaccharide biosynthesis polyprenyl glycosylphosphotransferase [Streptomyces sp. D2-8]|uniref:exopolysaccharide biosynthesis polyprenyl glycosylphosphotransferase n=1 Tax=Streptomyces sp. D2-8 TaxID=2707767 RepID=UPI0020BFC036|nr:exopolysaccharide biosynthesis polyprenyl glycosylphosphotransferase [Streptomyces sp. D2-8]MCK8431560.1 exopolysaccharide biosynthesis polyprenyl glycosylphosphotransferase [Streptomyces sp. D2-8]
MTAERTVPPPGGPPPERGFPPVSVIHPRGTVGDLRLPAERRTARRRTTALPLLAADAAAALTTAPALPHYLVAAPLLLAVLLLNARAALYRPAAVPAVLDELPAVCARVAMSWCALAAAVAALSPTHALSVRTLLTGSVLQSAASWAGRGAVHWHRRRALARHPAAALVVGPAATAPRVAAAFLRHPASGLRPVGVLSDGGADGGGLPVLSTDEEALRAVVQNSVRAVLIVGPAGERTALLRKLADAGCDLWEVDMHLPAPGRAGDTAYDEAGDPPRRRSRRERIAGFSCCRLEVDRRPDSPAKRGLDVLVSGILLVLAGPVLMVCAVVLRVSDGPRVLFRQERVGRGGRPFTLLKFRTHRPADPHEAATRWSVAGDRNMSRFCSFLRRTSLDELPQLWNVFRGDMTLVGPRPERPYFVAVFSHTYPGYAARHRMRTGLTGLAQIHGLRGDTSIEDRARFDNAYIDNWSLWQDVCILLRTVAALVRPTGS